jgi:hypothetical protein
MSHPPYSSPRGRARIGIAKAKGDAIDEEFRPG